MFDKRKQELAKVQELITGTKMFEWDIYELDSQHNSMTDFLNNLEMSLHKLGQVEHDIENIRQNQSLLDFCETVCNRENETELCMHRVDRLGRKVSKLQQHLADLPEEEQASSLKGLALQSGFNWFKDSCKEMTIRLGEVKENMKVN